MFRFLDGPAQGQSLACRRAPVLLRVVNDGRKWDALDQLADEPGADEAIHVYRRVGDATAVHVNCRGSRKGARAGGFYAMADYRLFEVQPSDDVMRDTKRWRSWCEEIRQAALAAAAGDETAESDDNLTQRSA